MVSPARFMQHLRQRLLEPILPVPLTRRALSLSPAVLQFPTEAGGVWGLPAVAPLTGWEAHAVFKSPCWTGRNSCHLQVTGLGGEEFKEAAKRLSQYHLLELFLPYSYNSWKHKVTEFLKNSAQRIAWNHYRSHLFWKRSLLLHLCANLCAWESQGGVSPNYFWVVFHQITFLKLVIQTSPNLLVSNLSSKTAHR